MGATRCVAVAPAGSLAASRTPKETWARFRRWQRGCFTIAMALVTAVSAGGEPSDRPIAFVSERDGNAEIYVINPDGSGLRNLTQHPASDTLPKWSPDGTRVAFLSDRDTTDERGGRTYRSRRLLAMSAEGHDTIELSEAAFDFAWSPRGDRVAYSRLAQEPSNAGVLYQTQVWIGSLDGSHELLADRGIRAAWSPDGTRLAVTSAEDWRSDVYTHTLSRVVVWDLAARAATDIHAVSGNFASNHVTMFRPLWMPDVSGLIATWEQTTSHSNLRGHGVLLMTPDGSDKGDLPVRAAEAISISPDGRSVLFVPVRQTAEQIYGAPFITDLGGADVRRLGQKPWYDVPPGRPSWSPESDAVVMDIGEWDVPSDLHIVKWDGSTPVRLTFEGGGQPDWQRAPTPMLPPLPSMAVVSPTEGDQLPRGSTSVRLSVRLSDYAGPWQWKLNGEFPSAGPGGGTTVSLGNTATIEGLEAGSLYTVDIAPVDAAGNVLEPHFHVQRRFAVAPPEPSPDLADTWIAFAVGRGEARSHIYRVRPDGSELTQITHVAARDRHPRWSPDGTRIAFDSKGRSEPTAVFVADLDGANRTRVTPAGLGAAEPDWSPDGRSVAFVGAATGRFSQIYAIDIDGSNLRQLTDVNNHVREPAWSPDGQAIAYTLGWWDNSDIAVVPAEGGASSPLWASAPGVEYSPAWSPDGRSLVFGRVVDSLYVAGLDARYDVRLDMPSTVRAWSPDGSMIVASYSDLYTLNADGTNRKRLDTPGSVDGGVDWSPFGAGRATAPDSVETQIRARLGRYVFPTGLLALWTGRSAAEVRPAGRGLWASDLVRLGASLCMPMDGEVSRGVIGRGGRIVAGSDFVISEGELYAINAIAPITVTLDKNAAWPAQPKSADAWAFAAAVQVAGHAPVAPSVRLRVTNEHTGTTVITGPSRGRFAALFASSDGDSVVQSGSTIAFQLIAASGYELGPLVRRVVRGADIELASMVVDIDARPDSVRALPNYPNPFNPETWLPFQLNQSADVDIRIYGADGALVRLLQLGSLPAGYYVSRDRAARWDGRNEAGETVAAGVYVTELRAGERRLLRRMVVGK
jgi:Tol biopolymer transport system component